MAAAASPVVVPPRGLTGAELARHALVAGVAQRCRAFGTSARIDPEALRRAAAGLVAARPELRTVYPGLRGAPMAVVLPPERAVVTITIGERAGLEEFVDADTDPARAIPFACALFSGPDGDVCVVRVHRIADVDLDGIVGELIAGYAGPLPELREWAPRPDPADGEAVAPPASEIPAEAQPDAGDDGPNGLTGVLVGLWRQVLEDPDIGPHDNFFLAGGHSLLALALLARVQEATGRTVRLEDLLDAATPAELAAYLAVAESGDVRGPGGQSTIAGGDRPAGEPQHEGRTDG